MTQHIIKTTPISKDLHRYAGEWVALSPDYRHIVAHGVRLTEVVAAISATDGQQVVYRKVLPVDADYAPVCIAEAWRDLAV